MSRSLTFAVLGEIESVSKPHAAVCDKSMPSYSDKGVKVLERQSWSLIWFPFS